MTILSTGDHAGAHAFVPLHISNANEEQVTTVRSSVQVVIGEVAKKSPYAEKRKDQRFPFPQLVSMTPIDDNGKTLTEETSTVIGKYISERGLDFYHQHPIAYRKVIVTLETPSGYQTSLILDLTWCRFKKQGWYDTGGRFLQTVENPIAVKSA